MVMAPPHTRGSTLEWARRGRRHGGSPAHAGIDPRRATRRGGSTRLPRTRGDRPTPSAARHPPDVAPPHTRGSTRIQRPHPVAPHGSPAHAGIDPRREEGHGHHRRLPRTRGDRPGAEPADVIIAAAPPHTRGSTRRVTHRHPAARGSPAHAGIDPAATRPATPCARLPRTRGDRPRFILGGVTFTGAPPHTRGSTRGVRRTPRRPGGSPAHAGIDPHRAATPLQRPRLPRTRGDRPQLAADALGLLSAPPHTRGSTPEDLAAVDLPSGSPAHAGIDPGRCSP